MANQEIDDLKSTQRKKSTLIAVAVVVIVVGVGLVGWLMSGADDTEYSLGSPCTSSCGVYDYDGWICLEEQGYCSRPCGETHPKCPMGFSCQQVRGAPSTVAKGTAVQASTYCLKGSS